MFSRVGHGAAWSHDGGGACAEGWDTVQPGVTTEEVSVLIHGGGECAYTWVGGPKEEFAHLGLSLEGQPFLLSLQENEPMGREG